MTVRVALDRNGKRLLHADVLEGLRSLPAESVQCVVSSPPYFGLRSYRTPPVVWGGDEGCEHVWGGITTPGRAGATNKGSPVHHEGHRDPFRNGLAYQDHVADARPPSGATCARCGAWRGELGSEKSVQPYIEHLMLVMAELWRVLRKDGTVWWNLGDSYMSQPAGNHVDRPSGFSQKADRWDGGAVKVSRKAPGIPPKSLTLVPERFAIACQEQGWIVRSDIAWIKKSPMPESVTDRPTSAWEHVFLLAKSPRYYYDAEAVRTEYVREWGENNGGSWAHASRSGADALTKGKAGVHRGNGYPLPVNGGANLKNYWLLGPDPLPFEHYAAFPREIARRAISAGSSERGACAACGAPWRRVTKKVGDAPHYDRWGRPTKRGSQDRYKVDGRDNRVKCSGAIGEPTAFGSSVYETTGWTRSCRCPEGTPTRPCVVLDCFSGSGTSLLVANQLGREAWGIELQPEYIELAIKRLQQDSLLTLMGGAP